ncbi:MAG: hypothetical protein ABFC77_04950 [Thermoguttaceae bacterium]
MGSVKKKGSSAISDFLAWLVRDGRSVLLWTLTLAALGGGWWWGWQRFGPQILQSPDRQVGPEQVEITPLPDWIHRKRGELQREVFRDPAIDGPLSLMDDRLTERIYQAFSRHPWVARVTSVTKQYPALVRVSLVYRRPACMVEVAEEPKGVWAVDSDGVLLPSEDFTSVEATTRYPHLTGLERKPTAALGQRWNDVRVVGGSEIAAALELLWDAMKLHRIAPMAAAPAAGSAGTEPQFVLTTRSGTQVLWGYAPGANVLGEPTAAQKVARLKKYLDDDAFASPKGQHQVLDVRRMGKSSAGAP